MTYKLWLPFSKEFSNPSVIFKETFLNCLSRIVRDYKREKHRLVIRAMGKLYYITRHQFPHV